jgi:glycosyltransferase involved in cell wall biosynthesis
MKISVIIPTHNRAESLTRAIESLLALKEEAAFEVVVVDNNSTDNTKAVAHKYAEHFPGMFKYVFEKRTAFTRARSTGAENASGDIFLYIDDDVIIRPGSLGNIARIFTGYPDTGIIAGKILSECEQDPPQWVVDCQRAFNGLSLFMKGVGAPKRDAGDFQEVTWAAGPMMAVRADLYWKVGGFPPDTIGVETNRGEKAFKKIYVGSGDTGLSQKIREIGYKVYYSEDISCYHVIGPVRFTVGFWRSRMIGEGHYNAVSNREFHKFSPVKLFLERKQAIISYLLFTEKLREQLIEKEKRSPGIVSGGMFPDELWVCFYKSYIETDLMLRKTPNFSAFLWDIATDGVDDNDFNYVMNRFPEEYKTMISEENTVLSDNPLKTANDLDSLTIHSEVASEIMEMEKLIASMAEAVQGPVNRKDLLAFLSNEKVSEKVLMLLRNILKQGTLAPELLGWIGCICVELGHCETAAKVFQQALRLAPENDEIKKLIECSNDVSLLCIAK